MCRHCREAVCSSKPACGHGIRRAELLSPRIPKRQHFNFGMPKRQQRFASPKDRLEPPSRNTTGSSRSKRRGGGGGLNLPKHDVKVGPWLEQLKGTWRSRRALVELAAGGGSAQWKHANQYLAAKANNAASIQRGCAVASQLATVTRCEGSWLTQRSKVQGSVWKNRQGASLVSDPETLEQFAMAQPPWCVVHSLFCRITSIVPPHNSETDQSAQHTTPRW